MLKQASRSRAGQVAAATLIGAIVGLIVFTIAHITGRNLYVIIGGLAGAAVVALQKYWRTAQ